MPHPTFTLELDGRRDGLLAMRRALRAWLTDAEATVDARDDVVLACWEAALNAVEHPDCSEPQVRISAECRDGQVVASVTDRGRWRASTPRAGRGLGLTLINGLMDRVVVTRTDRSTRVLMCRSLGTPHGQRTV